MKNFTIMCLLLFCISGTSLAQTGSISGTVVDATGALPGVTIILKGTNKGTVTNVKGEFRLHDVLAGTHILQISFIGYKPIEVEAYSRAGETNDMGRISIDEATTEMQEVVVQSTYLQGQMKALNIQKVSPRIMNVLAADGIGKLPDRNAAEAVQRIPGVAIERDQGEGRYVVVRGAPIQWSSTLINGDRLPATGNDRGVPLDIFPSELIQFVELSKALTPDIEGDAIGGSVNFITRTAPEKRILDVSAAAGLNNQSKSRIFNGSLVYGDRFLNDKLGVIMTAATWNRDWGSDNYELVYFTDEFGDNRDYALKELQLRDYLGNRTTYGLNGGAEYEVNKNNKIFARGMWSDFLDDEVRRQTRYYFPDEPDAAGKVRQAFTHTQYHSKLWGGELGGIHNLSGKLEMDWKLSSYKTKRFYDGPTDDNDENGYYSVTFEQKGVLYEGLASDGLKYLKQDSPDGTGDYYENVQPRISTETPVTHDQLAYKYATSSGTGGTSERDYVGQLNLKYNLSDRVFLKIGGKYRTKDRGVRSGFVTWTNTDPKFLSDYETESFPTQGGFLTEIDEPYGDVLIDHLTIDEVDDFPTTPGLVKAVQKPEDPSRARLMYDATENVVAGYAMAEINLGSKLMFLPGIRVENTTVDYTGNSVQGEVVSPVKGSKSTLSPLPMFHLKYSPTDKMNIRLATTRTLARPDFASLNPFETIDIANFRITKGNPELDPTYSWNYDILGEYYFDNVGVISGGFFYKNISNVIYDEIENQTIDGQSFRVIQPQNVERAWLKGFEISLQRRLTFLPGILSGLGIDVNYTWSDSEVQIPGRVEKQNLPDQAASLYNATIFFEKYGLLLRVAANYKGSYIHEIQGDDTSHDRIYDENLNLDFSGAYALSKKTRVFLELNNLLNSPLRYYHGNVNRPEQLEYYSWRGQAGIRVSVF